MLTTNTAAHYKTNLFHDVTILAAKTRDLQLTHFLKYLNIHLTAQAKV